MFVSEMLVLVYGYYFYVFLGLISGRPVLHSIWDATKVVVDIDIQEVVETRAELICG